MVVKRWSILVSSSLLWLCDVKTFSRCDSNLHQILFWLWNYHEISMYLLLCLSPLYLITQLIPLPLTDKTLLRQGNHIPILCEEWKIKLWRPNLVQVESDIFRVLSSVVLIYVMCTGANKLNVCSKPILLLQIKHSDFGRGIPKIICM